MPLLRELRGALSALALVVCGVLVLVSFDFGIPGQALLHSLRFHIAAVLLGFVVLHFLVGAWWRGLLFLVVFGLSAGQGGLLIYRQQEARGAVADLPSKPLFRIMNFNMLQSNLARGEDIVGFLEGSGADLILVLEAGPIKPYADRVARTYPYNSGCAPNGPCDMFLLSKTPLENVRIASLSEIWRNRMIVATTTIGGEAVNVVGGHMVKPYFDTFSEEEAWRLGATIRRMEGPVILIGDFNAAGWSSNIDRMARRTGLIPGPGYPATWPIRLGPLGVPIDNMWTRAPLFISSIRAADDPLGSNHRALIADVSLADAAAL